MKNSEWGRDRKGITANEEQRMGKGQGRVSQRMKNSEWGREGYHSE
jgi:hypothetical protein